MLSRLVVWKSFVLPRNKTKASNAPHKFISESKKRPTGSKAFPSSNISKQTPSIKQIEQKKQSQKTKRSYHFCWSSYCSSTAKESKLIQYASLIVPRVLFSLTRLFTLAGQVGKSDQVKKRLPKLTPIWKVSFRFSYPWMYPNERERRVLLLHTVFFFFPSQIKTNASDGSKTCWG